MTNAQTIRRIEQAYHDRSGCQLTEEDVVNLGLIFEIADAAGIAADLDAEDQETIELSGGG